MQHDREYYEAQIEALHNQIDRWKEKCDQLQADLDDQRAENESLLAGLRNAIKPTRGIAAANKASNNYLESANYTPRVDGKPFRCSCGCNVFRKPTGKPDIYVCNACSTHYQGA